MKTVFLLQHLHSLPGGDESALVIGIYKTKAAAETAVSRLMKQPGFKENPSIISAENAGGTNGFYIDEYELNKDNWVEGFTVK